MTQISSTLLNMLNSTSGSSGNGLLGVLSGGKTSSADSIFQASITARRQQINQIIEKHCSVNMETDTKKYENVAVANANTKKFLDALEDPALYEEKQETRDKILKKYVENLNKLQDAMKETGGTIQNTYGAELSDLYEENKEALEKIGLFKDNEGKWVLDEEKLKKADAESVKNVFTGEDSFGKKADQILTDMNEILNKALYIKQSLTSNYGKSGVKVDALINSVFSSQA